MPFALPSPACFENVSVDCKANVYFDGKVVSHTIRLASGERKTLGLIFPGAYSFNTGAAECMEIIAGNCRAKLPGEADWKDYPAGTFFTIPANASFEIAVDAGVAEYVCSFE